MGSSIAKILYLGKMPKFKSRVSSIGFPVQELHSERVSPNRPVPPNNVLPFIKDLYRCQACHKVANSAKYGRPSW
jgi:hypothetical protein